MCTCVRARVCVCEVAGWEEKWEDAIAKIMVGGYMQRNHNQSASCTQKSTTKYKQRYFPIKNQPNRFDHGARHQRSIPIVPSQNETLTISQCRLTVNRYLKQPKHDPNHSIDTKNNPNTTPTIQSIPKNKTQPRPPPNHNAEKTEKNTRFHTCCSFSRKAASSVSTLTAAARSISRTRSASSQ